MKLRLLAAVLVLAILGAVAWATRRLIRVAADPVALEVPTTKVKKGRVVISVAARGELQGGNSEMLSAPMTGNDSLAITYLREPGELVKAGDVVVQFDITTAGIQPARSPSGFSGSRAAGDSSAGDGRID